VFVEAAQREAKGKSEAAGVPTEVISVEGTMMILSDEGE
jgi:hypothetical protein